MLQGENVKDNKKRCLYGLETSGVSGIKESLTGLSEFFQRSKCLIKEESGYEGVIHKLESRLGLAPTAFRQLEVVCIFTSIILNCSKKQ